MIASMVKKQREFFGSGVTKDLKFRKSYLKKLRAAVITYEDRICDALYADFKKPKFESLATETQFVLYELDEALKNLDYWSKPKRVNSTWVNFPSSDWLYPQPYGNTLIIAPWNYPFLLTISPLIGALAAGNTAVLKPSEFTSSTAKIISEIITEVFPEDYVAVVEGGIETSQELLSLKWDYIFFTGSTKVGKIIYQKAAEHLTPVTLELGGKNPCIVDESATIAVSAKRIVWGKFLNCGQTCIAPDYILVHKKVKKELVKELGKSISELYGPSVEDSPDLARIAHTSHYEDLKEMLTGQRILLGGDFNDQTQYMAPTLVDEPKLESKIMEGEIFGPLLPIISYETEEDIDSYISNYEKPLALYVFSKKKKFREKMIHTYSFGGGVMNDTLLHITNSTLPFGGVGASGIGRYHGKYSFDTFSHQKAIIKKSFWPEIPLRYPPYILPEKLAKKLNFLFK
ncbi:aldehyde dehydrogenase [Maribacter algicola]|uniref:Aldehyde dehydrogenase n=1 Tax=Maribacter algicola TaxID=2498892 RepID=A0A3R8R0I9_9FLAO|nr:aldehyde dehydrogenase [Maribacter algicola]RRQ49276.1 aldehyde dehydrogenase [Maribacter algicola]